MKANKDHLRQAQIAEDLSLIKSVQWYLDSPKDHMPYALGTKKEMQALHKAVDRRFLNFKSIKLIPDCGEFYIVHVQKTFLDGVFGKDHPYITSPDPSKHDIPTMPAQELVAVAFASPACNDVEDQKTPDPR